MATGGKGGEGTVAGAGVSGQCGWWAVVQSLSHIQLLQPHGL